MELSGGRVQVGPGTLYTLLAKFQEGEIIDKTETVSQEAVDSRAAEKMRALPGIL